MAWHTVELLCFEPNDPTWPSSYRSGHVDLPGEQERCLTRILREAAVFFQLRRLLVRIVRTSPSELHLLGSTLKHTIDHKRGTMVMGIAFTLTPLCIRIRDGGREAETWTRVSVLLIDIEVDAACAARFPPSASDPKRLC